MNYKLFSTGLLQVYFVAINVVFLSHSFYIGMILSSFCISFLWTFNVSKVAFSGLKDKIIYSVGASIGSLLGLLTTKLFI